METIISCLFKRGYGLAMQRVLSSDCKCNCILKPLELIKCNTPKEQGIEYDMDEEDHVWLEIVNENRAHNGFKEVTPDQFEGVMDRLEKDSIFETNKPQKSAREIDDEAVCCVCNDGEVTTCY